MKNVVPKEVIESPEFKPFFDAITFILAEMKKQKSKSTCKLRLPIEMQADMESISNYGITVQFWFDHNFGIEYGIAIEWI